MGNLSSLPKMTWIQSQLLRVQQKREGLIKKRNRLTRRIDMLTYVI